MTQIATKGGQTSGPKRVTAHPWLAVEDSAGDSKLRGPRWLAGDVEGQRRASAEIVETPETPKTASTNTRAPMGVITC